MSASIELQTWIKGVLEANITLAANWGSAVNLFDHVPDEQSFPYLLYENGDSGEWDTSTELGWDVRPRIHVFSEGESSLFPRTILGTIENILHRNEPTVLTGYRLILLRHVETQCFREPDGQVWHGLASFRALLEEN